MQTQIIGINTKKGWSVIETIIPFVVGKTPILRILKRGLTEKEMREELNHNVKAI